MRKPRVTAQMDRTKRDLRDPHGKKRMPGVMVVPVMLSVDDWEATASVQQDKLREETAADAALYPPPLPAPGQAPRPAAIAPQAAAPPAPASPQPRTTTRR
jgi:hypothetical protein